MNIKYYAAAGANNGHMTSQQDVLSGETVNYAYDSLKRLASATSTQGWNQNFGYDGFGNSTSKTGNGIAPLANYAVDAATNRLTGGGSQYDANGNITAMNGGSLNYDVANRMTSTFGMIAGQGAYYEYDIGNQRIYQSKQAWDNNLGWVQQSEEWYFYGITEQKLGTYRAVLTGSTLSWSVASAQVFFGPKLLSRAGGVVQEDVRGSIGTYYPYGEDRSGAGGTDQVKFATYTRDSVTGLDYASQRYHLPGVGRFGSPDPYGGSARAGEPGSWNRFAYVGVDPIDGFDPTGLDATFSITVTALSTSTTLYLTPGQLCVYMPSRGCVAGQIAAASAAMAAMIAQAQAAAISNRPSIADARKRVVDRIDDNYANALGYSDSAAALDKLDRTDIKFGGLKVPAVEDDGRVHVLFAQNDNMGTITLNTNVNWNDPAHQIIIGLATPLNLFTSVLKPIMDGSVLSTPQFVDWAILHELAHSSMTVNPDDLEQQRKIFKQCIRD